MTLEQRVANALHSAQAASALRVLVADLAREGRAKAEIVELLDSYLVQQRTAADFGEEDEETVLDVLDALRGWCHPTAELLPEKPVR